MKKFFSLVLCFLMLSAPIKIHATEPALNINAKSALLMEASTGKILYEQNSHQKLPPASVTKVMTMLLIMEAIDDGRITMDEMVTASERAKSMGGSTIFLDTGERMSVHDLLKGIAVASGNDACVAMAEHIAGSESEFVRMMNEKAKQLGMNDTNFVNTNGLDAADHYSSAHDIALMSRELLKHDKIFEFTTIWIDSLRDGKFGLANTNKLIRFYQGANGLKTGSTSSALYCLSAAAKRENMQLIAVVMAAPTTKDRFDGARAMLDYGFSNYAILSAADPMQALGEIKVTKGEMETVPVRCDSSFSALIPKAKQKMVESKVDAVDSVSAPIKSGEVLGTVKFYLDGEMIGEVDLVAAADISRKSLGSTISKLFKSWLN